MIRVLSLFSGIGAFEKALDNLGIEFELSNYCEIDKYASKAYSLIHNENESKNLGDITKIDVESLSSVDLITYGFPCQDISLAGKQKGLFNEDGTRTRSGLFFNALEIIEHCRPKIAIAENVKNLTSKKFTEQFKIVLDSLEKAGYNNYWKVLNSKDYGIPQNRERVFIVSIRKDCDNGRFEFPEPYELKLRLKDLLETEVDEKYFLSDDKIQPLLIGFKCEDVEPFNPMPGGTCRCIKNQYFKNSQANFIKQTDQGATCVVVRTNNSKGYDLAEVGDSINFEQPKIDVIGNYSPSNHDASRIVNSQGIAPTVKENHGTVTATNTKDLRIRKLTPKECFRLQGFDDKDIDVLIENGFSNTQLYKMAGNSITVDVIQNIYRMLSE